MKKLAQPYNNERGAVALLTTMIISILIALLLLAMVSLMVSEQRQQDDDAQGVAALYSAQSGVEDALHRLAGLNPAAALPSSIGNRCLTVTFVNNAPSVSCEYITKSGQPTGTLSASDQATQIEAGAGYSRVVVSWDVTSGKPSSYYSYPGSGSVPNAVCTAGSCPATYNYAPPLEIAFAQYPTASTFKSNDPSLVVRNALFVPATTGPGVTSFALLGNQPGINPIKAICSPTAAIYHCKATIIGLNSGYNYVLRLRTRFSNAGTSYSVAFQNGIGGNVAVPDGSYTIDVTAASAGGATRRVLYKVPYKNSTLDGLDYVLYSDTNISKNFCSIGNGQHPSCN